MKHIKPAVRAFRAAYHRRRIAQIRGKMERCDLRGTPLSSEKMIRLSLLLSKHCICLERGKGDGVPRPH